MGNTSTADRIRQVFIEKFNEVPRLFRSPGRINLIGEHTDYNQGFVLPASVDKAVYFAITPREDDLVFLYAADLGLSYAFELDDLSKSDERWAHYQLAVLDQLKKAGIGIRGFQAAFGGDIPVGAGMSSSAALECCLLFALNELFALNLDRMTIVKMGQKAENEYVGVNCGIMDQFASVFGRSESVIQLDCRSLQYEYFPFPMNEYQLVLCDTGVKHSLADSEYNTRRKECEEGIAILKRFDPRIQSLRDVSVALVERYKEELGELIYKRCKYITEEIERVQVACQLLTENRLELFGRKMYETHTGLSREYEVSCDELDFLVEQTANNPDVAGARMMGGGFGGCTINLVRHAAVERFEERMIEAYRIAFGIELSCYRVTITGGSEEVSEMA